MIILIYTLFTSFFGIILLAFVFRLERSIRQFQVKKQYTSAIEAPSVSVCIPARNEKHAMAQCLERVLASDYRKLEVIVFDDESIDNTSILIQSFAQAGVRFVPGTTLPEGWLGKNHALEVLAREASGTYVIFLDVDTFIQPTTISQLVGYTMTENLEMSSIIPERSDPWQANVFFGHLRYFWKLILSRETDPAISSSLWMIKRHTLLTLIGGFSAYSNDVEPEQRLASLVGSKAYHCLLGTRRLGVSYEKKWQSQVETSRRLLYPMFGASGRSVAIVLLILLGLAGQVVLVLSYLFVEWTRFHSLTLMYLLLFCAVYSRYTFVVWRKAWYLGFFAWPLVIVQELFLYAYSVIGYARGTVTWKGRPVSALAYRSDGTSAKG